MKKNKIPVALTLVKSRSAFSDKNQKRIFSLGLIGMNQERLRLYEELPNGRKEAEKLPKEERAEHFKNFLPDVDSVNRKCSFGIDYLMSFTGLKESSLYKTIGKASKSIHSKGISYDHVENGVRRTGGFSPIYDGDFSTVTGLTFRLAERAVIEMMNHSKGFNEIDIKLLTELDSIHAIKLLEVISGNKTTPMYDWKLDTFRYRFNVDCKRFESEEHISEYIALGGYRMDDVEVGDKIVDQDGNVFPIYPKTFDLKLRVIGPAFKEIIDKSCGMWTATDEKGLGYELVKTGTKYTHIKFCLKYNPDADKLPLGKPDENKCKQVPDTIEDAEIVEPNIDSETYSVIKAAKELLGDAANNIDEEQFAKIFGKALFEHMSNSGFIDKHKGSLPGGPKQEPKSKPVRDEFDVGKFAYSSLMTYWETDGIADMGGDMDAAMEFLNKREPTTLVVSETEVTRTPVGDGDWQFEYAFADKYVVITKDARTERNR